VVHTITNKSYSAVSLSLWVNITSLSRAQLLPLLSLQFSVHVRPFVTFGRWHNKFATGISTERALQSTLTMLQYSYWILRASNVIQIISQKLYWQLIYKSMENIYKKLNIQNKYHSRLWNGLNARYCNFMEICCQLKG
jgi:hypothetical protein